MATNRAPSGRKKYCPVNEAPEPAMIRERAPTNYETPQLRTLRYRPKYTPGNESTYWDGKLAVQETEAEERKTEGG